MIFNDKKMKEEFKAFPKNLALTSSLAFNLYTMQSLVPLTGGRSSIHEGGIIIRQHKFKITVEQDLTSSQNTESFCSQPDLDFFH